MYFKFRLLACFVLFNFCARAQKPLMYYTDITSGKPIAKDPYVVYYQNRYLMYYSIPGANNGPWNIGIAQSNNLTDWIKVGEIKPTENYEAKGICAPGCTVKDGKLHLFYQTYGNGKDDAICHAVSDDGLNFIKDTSNPVFKPSATWSCGRAIDAEVVLFKNHYFMYFATRDSSYKIQEQGVAVADSKSDFSRMSWKLLSTAGPILKPEFTWETRCTEGASCIRRGNYLYMFYAGGYNNDPQQIGVARSKDGLIWQKISDKPFLTNGMSGSWNESESGHPDIFKDKSGRYFLFFQGNNTKGNSWYLSKVAVKWSANGPSLQ